MDKETVKKMISDLIDSALDGEWVERRDTGRTNICITIYKEQ